MSSVPGVEKRPSVYEQYVTTLEPKYRENARLELHEDDNTRGPALAQMREFIAKHPQIIRCRTDSVFLLRFLRSQKFNVLAAQRMLEKWLEAGHLGYEFFVEIDPYRLEPLIDRNIVVPLGADNQGRLVLVTRFGRFDSKTTSPEEQTRLISLSLETYLDTEIYQVTGLVIIFDFQDATMAHFGIWTIPKLKVIINALNDILAFRIKEIHSVQLPKFAAMIADFCIAGLSEKLQRRIKASVFTFINFY
ncbi:clavesin-1-like [Wyeomyia smithii]|uniref:clavesin-1-like n=1 Tax=Wyeomyia smithii TaxID=174621 RepID=UPI002467E118|nr:clavesin-1-like [Wyeomyia smithii]